MITAPDIINSTVEERRNYIKEKYPCIVDCDMCGICTVFTAKMQKLHMKHIFAESDLLKIFQRITDEAMSGKDGTNENSNKSINSGIRKRILRLL